MDTACDCCPECDAPNQCLRKAQEALARGEAAEAFRCGFLAFELAAKRVLSDCPKCSSSDKVFHNIQRLRTHSHITEHQANRIDSYRDVRNLVIHADLEPSVAWAARAVNEIAALCTTLAVYVADIMSSPVIKAKPEDVLASYIRLVCDDGISQFPVVAAQRIVGTLDESCLFHAAFGHRDGEIADQRVVDVMRDQPLPGIGASEPISTCRQRIIGGKSSALLVFDRGELVGIVTKYDLLKSA